MMTDKDQEKPEFTTRCAVCGHALRPSEVGGNLSGEFIDYVVDRARGEADIDFCIEHWTMIMQNCIYGDQRTSVARRRVAESLCKETKEKFWDAMSDVSTKITEIDDMLREVEDE